MLYLNKFDLWLPVPVDTVKIEIPDVLIIVTERIFFAAVTCSFTKGFVRCDPVLFEFIFHVLTRFTILCNKNVILCIEMLRYLLYNLIISFVKEFVNMAVNYRKTLISCYLGFITQAIAANFAPLLFLTFHNGYCIPL